MHFTDVWITGSKWLDSKLKIRQLTSINPIRQVEYQLQKDISERWSPRAFSKEELQHEDIMSIFEAARWAASGNNNQPWRFIYALKDQELFKTILDGLVEGNQLWAQHAAALIVVVGRTNHEYKEKENKLWRYDVGLAVGTMSIQAQHHQVYLHQMAGIHADKLREDLNISEPFQPIVAIAAGRLGNPDSLPSPFDEREKAHRERKTLDELVFNKPM